jgi:signal transduction histidine kinase
LTNVVKHAAATQAEIIVRGRGGAVEVVVFDNGKGFDADGTFAGFGLLGMRERLALVGGSLDISSHDGEGTTIRATFRDPRSQADEWGAAIGA